MTETRTDRSVSENVEEAGLWSPAFRLQLSFIYNVHHLSKRLVPQSLHDGSKPHLMKVSDKASLRLSSPPGLNR